MIASKTLMGCFWFLDCFASLCLGIPDEREHDQARSDLRVVLKSRGASSSNTLDSSDPCAAFMASIHVEAGMGEIIVSINSCARVGIMWSIPAETPTLGEERGAVNGLELKLQPFIDAWAPLTASVQMHKSRLSPYQFDRQTLNDSHSSLCQQLRPRWQTQPHQELPQRGRCDPFEKLLQ